MSHEPVQSLPGGPRSGGTNVAGTVSAAAAVVLVVGRIFQAGASPFLAHFLLDLGLRLATVFGVMSIGLALIAVAGLVSGVIGLLIPDRPRRAALVGTAVAVAHLVPALVGAVMAAVAAVMI